MYANRGWCVEVVVTLVSLSCLPAIAAPLSPTDQQKADLAILFAPKFDVAKLEAKEFNAIKSRLSANAAAYNSAILDVYLGPNFDVAVVPQSSIVDLARWLYRYDPKGALEVAKALKVSVDNCLTIYDLAKDKKALFTMVSDKDAQKIKELLSFREKVFSLISDFEKSGKSKQK
jgi:hypothetical protein